MNADSNWEFKHYKEIVIKNQLNDTKAGHTEFILNL